MYASQMLLQSLLWQTEKKTLSNTVVKLLSYMFLRVSIV